MRHVLLTGGSGFLGRYALEYLAHDSGLTLHVLSRDKNKLTPHISRASNVVFYEADITDRAALEAVSKRMPAIDSVVHLAAHVPKTKQEDVLSLMVAANIGGLVNVLEVWGERAEQILFASTAEVYDFVPKGVINEDASTNPSSFYASTKLAGEIICRTFGEKHDVVATILRFSVMYGPADDIKRAVPNFIKQALKGDELTVYGRETLRDYLHVSDGACAVLDALKQPTSGIFNIASGQLTSILEAATTIRDRVDSQVQINVLEPKPNSFDVILDIKKAKNELKFVPKVFFPEKLDEVIQWQQNH